MGNVQQRFYAPCQPLLNCSPFLFWFCNVALLTIAHFIAEHSIGKSVEVLKQLKERLISVNISLNHFVKRSASFCDFIL